MVAVEVQFTEAVEVLRVLREGCSDVVVDALTLNVGR
jgi:hypothetical protein